MPRNIRYMIPLFAAVLALGLWSPAVAESPASSVSVAWSAAQVEYGDRVTVSGSVSPAGSREVVLERISGDESVARIAAVRSQADGSFSLPVPSDVVGQFTYRVSVPADSGLRTLLPSRPVESEPYVVRVLRDTSVGRLRWPVARLAVDTATTVRGVVTGGDAGTRLVHLQQRLVSGWVTVRSARTNSDGSYVLPLPTNWYYRSRIRVFSPPTATATAFVSGWSVTAVVPRYAPAGRSWSWSRLSSKHEFRFDPCRAISYRLNLARAPRGGAMDAHRAIGQLAQATGLRFRYLGTTTSMPGTRRKWSPDTNLVIAWARPSESSWDLRGKTVGRGGVVSSQAVRQANGSWSYRITRAGVLIDSTASMRGGFGPGSLRGRVLMHELAHAAGLGHTSGAYQVLREVISTAGPARWGAGDLTGLSRIGKTQGCL